MFIWLQGKTEYILVVKGEGLWRHTPAMQSLKIVFVEKYYIYGTLTSYIYSFLSILSDPIMQLQPASP